MKLEVGQLPMIVRVSMYKGLMDILFKVATRASSIPPNPPNMDNSTPRQIESMETDAAPPLEVKRTEQLLNTEIWEAIKLLKQNS